jgi:flagellar basal-body rod protein FlgB
MSIFQTSAIPILEQVVNFSQARHEVLAGNIANLDTPGYVARDLSVADFQARLQHAIDESRQPSQVAGSTSDYYTSVEKTNHISDVADEAKSILYHDDSNIGAEYQVNEMIKNRAQHNMAIAILSQQFRLLQAAISEKA